MREVIVTVGTRAAGKSTFCKKALTLDPSLAEVSRDKILVGLFGSDSLDPYKSDDIYGYQKMWGLVEKILAAQEARMIFDVWNGDSNQRRAILNRLHALDVDKVVAWYFTTPVEAVEEWFWKKPGIARIAEMRDRKGENLVFYGKDAPRHDHELFHKLASNIDLDGFDEVIRINPVTTGPEHVLALQTSLNF